MNKEKVSELISSFVAESHLQCSLSNFDWRGKEQLRIIINDWLEGKRKKGILLMGEPGVGKTHLQVGIFKYLVEKGKDIGLDVIYMDWSKWIQEVLSTMKFGVIPENAVRSLVNIEWLLIDDIRPMMGQVWSAMLKKLIEEIYEKKRIAVLSTNASSVEELIKWWQIEDYWVSRLVGTVDIVVIKGKDRRVNE